MPQRPATRQSRQIPTYLSTLPIQPNLSREPTTAIWIFAGVRNLRGLSSYPEALVIPEFPARNLSSRALRGNFFSWREYQGFLEEFPVEEVLRNCFFERQFKGEPRFHSSVLQGKFSTIIRQGDIVSLTVTSRILQEKVSPFQGASRGYRFHEGHFESPCRTNDR